MAVRIKQEKPSFSDVEESDSESEGGPIIPPIEIKKEATESGDEDDEDDDNQFDKVTNVEALEALISKNPLPGLIEVQLKKYLENFPRIKPLPATKSYVDIDLADPDEETWIIQCPASIDIHRELLNKKLNLSEPRSKIKHCSTPLETHVTPNTGEQSVGLMCGTRIKSFVPAGFLRITETPTAPINADSTFATESNNVQVPFPESLPQRHPLLGYDFETSMAVSKRVQKRLTRAREQADLFYTTPASDRVKQCKSKSKSSKLTSTVSVKVELETDTVSEIGSPTKSKSKRIKQESSVSVKVEPENETASEMVSPRKTKKRNLSTVETAAEVSPSKKAKRKDATAKVTDTALDEQEAKPITIKKEQSIEDDISWLLNI